MLQLECLCAEGETHGWYPVKRLCTSSCGLTLVSSYTSYSILRYVRSRRLLVAPGRQVYHGWTPSHRMAFPTSSSRPPSTTARTKFAPIAGSMAPSCLFRSGFPPSPVAKKPGETHQVFTMKKVTVPVDPGGVVVDFLISLDPIFLAAVFQYLVVTLGMIVRSAITS